MGKKFSRKRLRHSNFPLRIAAKLPRKSPEELKLSRQDLLIELIVSENSVAPSSGCRRCQLQSSVDLS
ncbi:hypothetical protein TNCT_221531 [Trichonephila clavata]|nr:hypothetical protein TNCT_321841 [Trichonephila clavata]GFR23923.1 hypothetical protein TNCT_221531 [Trichonephila clavata]